MRFIHVSDVHLGMIPDKGKPWSDVRAKEIEETFDRILNIAEERKVDLLLMPAICITVRRRQRILQSLMPDLQNLQIQER